MPASENWERKVGREYSFGEREIDTRDVRAGKD
jgi:hypothetical protein